MWTQLLSDLTNASGHFLDKCGVFHCGNQQAPNDYVINSKPLTSVTSLKELGIIRSSLDALYEGLKDKLFTARRVKKQEQ